MEDEHRQNKWKKMQVYRGGGRGGGYALHIERPRTKDELKADRQDSSLWFFFLLIICITALGFPFIIHWLR